MRQRLALRLSAAIVYAPNFVFVPDWQNDTSAPFYMEVALKVSFVLVKYFIKAAESSPDGMYQSAQSWHSIQKKLLWFVGLCKKLNSNKSKAFENEEIVNSLSWNSSEYLLA